ncbi:MAG: site-specific integrase [Acidimicrobiia bacterium]
MKGSIRRRGGAWQLRVYAGRDAVTDRKRWVTRTVHGAKRDAERELAAMVLAADHNESGTNNSVATLLERWFDHAAPDWSPRTVVQHRHVIDHHLRPRFGAIALDRLGASDIDAFYAWLRRSQGASRRALAPATIRRIHAVLRSALAQGVKWGWIMSNPADRATAPRVVPPNIAPPELQDLRRVLALIEDRDPDLFVYLRLAIVTGARRSQLLGVQWRDVDLRDGVIVFRWGVVDGPDGIVLKSTKSHRAYQILLDDASAALLDAHHDCVIALAKTAGVTLDAAAFIFSREPDGSRPLRPDSVSHRWIRLRRELGLPNVRLHDLRHFAATSLLGAGVPVNIVAGRLGHARAATTLNVYAHFTESGDRSAADALGGMLDGADSEPLPRRDVTRSR